MKNTLLTLVGAAALVAFTQTSSAVPITGAIGFFGNANLDTGTALTATTVTSWSGTIVGSDSGIISTIITPGTAVTFSSPWTFAPGPLASSGGVASLINNFWTVPSIAGLSFDLASWTYLRGNIGGQDYVFISGTGLLHANGYDATQWDFSVTFQDPASVPQTQTFTWSASQHAVPDGGMTVMLLGAALSGIALIKRKLTA